MKINEIIKDFALLTVLINLIALPVNAADDNINTLIINNEDTTIHNFNKITPITNQLLNNKEEKITLFATKYKWDLYNSGDCTNNADCWNGSSCVPDKTFIDDNYCDNGNWTTRTKLTALKLLDSTAGSSENYTLFCDNYDASINYKVYDIQPPYSLGDAAKKFCVLTYYPDEIETVIIGASLKEDYDSSLSNLLVSIEREATYCDNVVGSNFAPCGIGPQAGYAWYNPSIQSVIFSKGRIALVAQTQFYHQFIQSLLQPILDLAGLEPFAEPWINDAQPLIENTSYFNKLFILQSGQKRIFAVLEEEKYSGGAKYDYLDIDYANFYSDICLSVNQYSTGEEYIKCAAKGLSEFLITRKTRPLRQQDAISAWLRLTAQIRAKDVPDTWPPKIQGAGVTPPKGYQGMDFTISATLSDPSGVNIVNATIRNETDRIITLPLTPTSAAYNYTSWTTTWTSSLNNPSGIYYIDIYAEDGTSPPNSITHTNVATFEIILRPICIIEAGGCTAGANEIFSLSGLNDAHFATFSYFSPAKMCCIFSASDFTISTSSSNELFGFSISGQSPFNDQHIGDVSTFNYKAYLSNDAPLSNCHLNWLVCPGDKTNECILTLSGLEEGHITPCDVLGTGEIPEFEYKLCCTRN